VCYSSLSEEREVGQLNIKRFQVENTYADSDSLEESVGLG
jgi:hypothetical protein